MTTEDIDKRIGWALKDLLTIWLEWGSINSYTVARAKGLYAKKDIHLAMAKQ